MVKGEPVLLLQGVSQDTTSEEAVDCTRFNALALHVTASGSSPSATLTTLGSSGQNGQYQTVADPNGTKIVTASQILYVSIGSIWGKVKLSAVSGLFTVVAIPFISPGPTLLKATVP